MDLIYFILCAYGLTQILVYGSIFDKVRPRKGILGELFRCSMCFGFHVGWFLLLISQYTTLFSFDITFVNAFLLGCLGSATSYVLNMVFGDDGFKITHKGE